MYPTGAVRIATKFCCGDSDLFNLGKERRRSCGSASETKDGAVEEKWAGE
ncbi:uncharacterized protein RAG0_04264 [Rhynchosporium agropyri]|uniref:Uncharacterized protein n=2 Tax=Rhynchosporium TaxID=38037 RepID=A0A1E1MK90_RHYSE|nr:uncharacterized protein RAG0_04264 [Rhynchosporium agropyri]CZT49503.1 uncharacterized protein RSE6_10361 [Rhynchosporium secalis]